MHEKTQRQQQQLSPASSQRDSGHRQRTRTRARSSHRIAAAHVHSHVQLCTRIHANSRCDAGEQAGSGCSSHTHSAHTATATASHSILRCNHTRAQYCLTSTLFHHLLPLSTCLLLLLPPLPPLLCPARFCSWPCCWPCCWFSRLLSRSARRTAPLPPTPLCRVGLLTAIVSRAAIGGVYANSSGYNFTIPGLLAPSGPLYAIFSGQIQYRVGAPNYTDPSNGSLGILAGKAGRVLRSAVRLSRPRLPGRDQHVQHVRRARQHVHQQRHGELLRHAAGPHAAVAGRVGRRSHQHRRPGSVTFSNRCGGPIAALNATAPVQICGTSDCPLANGANYGTCVQYYAYPASSSSSSSGAIAATSSSNTANPFISSSSSGNTSSNAATGKYGLAVVPVVVAAIVASLVL